MNSTAIINTIVITKSGHNDELFILRHNIYIVIKIKLEALTW
jgi:hypothetical protein